ncbi:MAG: hypothetical protein KF724_06345 [Phycisphaeraceae bacterium]|nr:hypothetical protein [Phycisphaeraceae bacterium]
MGLLITLASVTSLTSVTFGAPRSALGAPLIAEPSARAVPDPPASPASNDIDAALLRLDQFRRDARDRSLTIDARRQAAEALLDGTEDLARAHPDDPRVGLWIAGAAEECFTILLPLGGDLDAVLFGLPSHQEWRRTSAGVARMLDLSRRADAAVARSVSQLGEATRSLDPDDVELLDRYETVEAPRRVPLLLGMAEALAAALLERDEQGRRLLGESSLDRLGPLLSSLDADALDHAAFAMALAAATSGDRARADAAVELARRPTASPEARMRAEFLAAACLARLGAFDAASDRLAQLRERERSARRTDLLDILRRTALLEARILRDASTQAASSHAGEATATAPRPSWTEPLRSLPASAALAERAALRDALLARLVDVAEGSIDTMDDAPLSQLAVAEVLARQGADQDAQSRVLRALEALRPDEPWRAMALELAARQAARLDQPDFAVDHLLELADSFRSESLAASAVARAVILARAADDGRPGSDARTRLERAIDLAVRAFPDHPERASYRTEAAILRIEAAAALRDGRRSTLEEAERELSSIRSALAAERQSDAASDHRVRVALALSQLAIAALDGDAALRALALAPDPADTPHANARLLLQRVPALALLDRPIADDPLITAALAGDMRAAVEPRLVSMATASLRTFAPPLPPGGSATGDPVRRAAAQRLVDFMRSQGEVPDEDLFAAAEALRATGAAGAALPLLQELLVRAPDRADLLFAEAEVLLALPREAAQEQARLTRALSTYQRFLAGREYSTDPQVRDALWWHCQWRQLECLDRAGTDRARIAARIERLRALDPSLGGELFSARVRALLERPE